MRLKWRRPEGLRPNGPFAASSLLNAGLCKLASSLFLASGPFGRNADSTGKANRSSPKKPQVGVFAFRDA